MPAANSACSAVRCVGQAAVGLGLLGAVAGGVAPGLTSSEWVMRVAEAPEHHAEDGSDRDEEPRAAEDGAGDCQRREDDQRRQRR